MPIYVTDYRGIAKEGTWTDGFSLSNDETDAGVKWKVAEALSHGESLPAMLASLPLDATHSKPKILHGDFSGLGAGNLLGSIYLRRLLDLNEPKEFIVSAGLAERLVDTRLRGVCGQDLRLPFPSIRIELPVGLDFGIGPTTKITHFMICEFNRNLTILVDHHMNEENEERSEGPNGEDREGIIHVGITDESSLDEIAAASTFYGYEQVKLGKFVEFLFNAILYMTNVRFREEASNKDWKDLSARIQRLPPGSKKERLKERRRSLDPGYFIYIGRDVPRLGSATEGNHLVVRTKVTGHWKMQAHGPKLSERKLIWIEPYWKGPDHAPETNPTRVAGQSATPLKLRANAGEVNNRVVISGVP